MIGLLSFILECAAVAAAIGTIVSIVMLMSWLALRSLLAKAAPTLRAEVAFVFGVLPSLTAATGTLAVALPPILAALGWARDHCPHHLHHLHVCMIHSAGLRPALATIGAFAMASFIIRAAALFHGQLELRRTIDRLVPISTAVPGPIPVLEVPGEPWLCHALGLFRGRILLSASLRLGLHADQVRSALAHEAAHLRRRDPLANLLLSIAALFSPPGMSAIFARAYRTAAEEACDDHAASAVGDRALVADALVAVAELQRGSTLGWTSPAFGELLEGRVRRLLDRGLASTRPSRALWIGALSATVLLTASIVQSSTLHHAVETILSQLF